MAAFSSHHWDLENMLQDSGMPFKDVLVFWLFQNDNHKHHFDLAFASDESISWE